MLLTQSQHVSPSWLLTPKLKHLSHPQNHHWLIQCGSSYHLPPPKDPPEGHCVYCLIVSQETSYFPLQAYPVAEHILKRHEESFHFCLPLICFTKTCFFPYLHTVYSGSMAPIPNFLSTSDIYPSPFKHINYFATLS